MSWGRFTPKGRVLVKFQLCNVCFILPPRQKKYPVDFDGESKIGDVRYDNMT